MKSSSLIAAVVAFFALLLAPSVAFAAPSGDGYGGPAGGVVVSPPSEPDANGCSTTSVTVTPDDDSVTSVTITVTDEDGTVVDTQTKPVTDGKATFSVTVCGEGTYTVSAEDQDGNDLGQSQFTVEGASQGGDNNSDDTTGAGAGSNIGGGLPNTGATIGLTVGAGLGLLLLLGGTGLVVKSRRRLTA